MQIESTTKTDSPGPVAPRDRIAALDVLRGFAVLGILVMNVQSFAMVDAAYMNPHYDGRLTGAGYAVWYACHLLADMKFMTLFSTLFGAGIVLSAERREARGQPVAGFYYRRTFWLLVIGAVHAYVIWHGDVLVLYAMTGAVVYLARRLPAWALIVLGTLLLLIGSGILALGGLSIPYWEEAELAELQQEWAPSEERIADEIAMFRGGWLDHAPYRAEWAWMIQTYAFAFFFFWRVGGLVLLGMALQKLSVIDASRGRRLYLGMALLGLGIGLPLVVAGVRQNDAHAWQASYAMFVGFQFNYWGSLLVASAYVGLIMLACQAGRLRWLAPVGQMALTNYLAQSVFCTLIFYGHGLGHFGAFSRPSLLLLVAVILLTQIVLSNLWLLRYRYGPMEWLWRSLTYGRRQPMLRMRASAS